MTYDWFTWVTTSAHFDDIFVPTTTKTHLDVNPLNLENNANISPCYRTTGCLNLLIVLEGNAIFFFRVSGELFVVLRRHGFGLELLLVWVCKGHTFYCLFVGFFFFYLTASYLDLTLWICTDKQGSCAVWHNYCICHAIPNKSCEAQ